MLPVDGEFTTGERRANALKQHAEELGVLDEFQDIDDDIPRPGIEHYALDLPHFVAPQAAQVVIDRRTSLAPQLQAPGSSGSSIFDFEDCGL